MILLVVYDPNAAGLQKTRLYDTLKKARHWMHYIRGCWMLVTDDEPEPWVDRISPYLGGSFCFVTRVNEEHQGWLPDKAWAWLARNAKYM